MDWTQARKNLLHLAQGRRPGISGFSGIRAASPRVEPDADAGQASPSARQDVSACNGTDPERVPRARSVCVVSGKGGTGKSVVSASLANLLGADGRTLIVDADMGVGNAHILQDVAPVSSFVEVVEGKSDVRDVVVACGNGLDLVGAGSGVPHMAELSSFDLHLIASGLEDVERDYRYLLVDSAAGISRQTVGFAVASDIVLVVTTPDLTAMTDAYAFLKVLLGRQPEREPFLLVNRARGEQEARDVAERITRVCERFLLRSPRLLGWLPDDQAVTDCVNRRGSVVALEPGSPFALAFRRAATRIQQELDESPGDGLGRRLLQHVGYPSRLG